MWATVAARKHTVFRIYPFGSNGRDFMLRGCVEYKLKNGDQSQKDWAAHAVLAREATGSVLLQFYQVFLVGSTVRSVI
jgi:hypothetical protein